MGVLIRAYMLSAWSSDSPLLLARFPKEGQRLGTKIRHEPHLDIFGLRQEHALTLFLAIAAIPAGKTNRASNCRIEPCRFGIETATRGTNYLV